MDGWTATPTTRNQISGGKQMEGQMDRDCETSAAVSQVYREMCFILDRTIRELITCIKSGNEKHLVI